MSLASGSIDLKSLKVANDSAKTATSYITYIDEEGIFISPANNSDPETSPGNSVRINGEGVGFFKNDTLVALYGSNGINLNSEVGLKVIDINSGGLIIYNGTGSESPVATYSGDGISLYNNGVTVFNVASSATTVSETVNLGQNHIFTDGTIDHKYYCYNIISNNYIQNGDVVTVRYGTTSNIPPVGGSTFTYGTSSNFTITPSLLTDPKITGSYDSDTNLLTITVYDTHVDRNYYFNISATVSVPAPTVFIGKKYTGTEYTPGSYSLSEGSGTLGVGTNSHAEGNATFAIGNQSHSEGINTIARNASCHAEGNGSLAEGAISHAQGLGTTAMGYCETTIGKYNSLSIDTAQTTTANLSSTYILIAGKGSSSTNRSNAMTLDWSGNLWTAGNINIASNKKYQINGTDLSASDVGAAASSHTHGDITNAGDITATAPTIASGDKIIINDESESKITNGPSFDGSTGFQFLTRAGTWGYPIETYNYTEGSFTGLANNTDTSIYTFSLPRGRWHIDVAVRFPTNATGYREIHLVRSSDSASYGIYATDTRAAVSGNQTFAHISYQLTVNSATDIKVYAKQNSGSSMGTTSAPIYIRCSRIGIDMTV